MKKLLMLAVVMALGLVAVGCGPTTPSTKPGTPATPAAPTEKKG